MTVTAILMMIRMMTEVKNWKHIKACRWSNLVSISYLWIRSIVPFPISNNKFQLQNWNDIRVTRDLGPAQQIPSNSMRNTRKDRWKKYEYFFPKSCTVVFVSNLTPVSVSLKWIDKKAWDSNISLWPVCLSDPSCDPCIGGFAPQLLLARDWLLGPIRRPECGPPQAPQVAALVGSSCSTAVLHRLAVLAGTG